MTTQSSKQATDFYKEVAKSKKVWTVRDKKGFPAPRNIEGKRSLPFWSSLQRVKRIISEAPNYTKFTPHEFTFDEFSSKWVPGMKKDGILAGLNWGGVNAAGYDVDSEEVLINVNTILSAGR